MKQVASLRYGVIFKKAFSDPDIFKAFVRDFLGIKLEIDKVETEKSFDPPIGRVACRFDLFAEDKKNRIIVDIQHERHEDHYDRFLHYHCDALLEQIASSKSYRPEVKVFTLVVLTSGDKHKKDISIIDFDPRDLEGNPLGEIPHKVMYICPKYVNDKTPESYREWMLAIEDSLDETVEESTYHSPDIQKVFQYIEKDKVSPYDRAKMFDEYNLEKLKQKTRAEGKAEGRAEGKAEGFKEATEQTAIKMLKTGILSHEQIAELTGLTTERVKSLSLLKEKQDS
jgi:predicted transposase/invertase (TIGR01784 family)